MKRPEQITLEEFNARLLAQGVPYRHYAFKCPICGTVQSMASLVKAGVPRAVVHKYIAYSCEGRFTGAPSVFMPPEGAKSQGQRGCDWTLGGLLSLHKMEVWHEGAWRARFEVATPEEARALAASMDDVA